MRRRTRRPSFFCFFSFSSTQYATLRVNFFLSFVFIFEVFCVTLRMKSAVARESTWRPTLSSYQEALRLLMPSTPLPIMLQRLLYISLSAFLLVRLPIPFTLYFIPDNFNTLWYSSTSASRRSSSHSVPCISYAYHHSY